ncbi:hypothetical protein [Salininema proteolyticum]|uniref:Uncharacterized protein n=1 Tax=Salininema proteolyticum TaxID=1607685 RepID=A0ABV8TWX0_9ACTN
MTGTYSCSFCGTVNRVPPQPCIDECSHCGTIRSPGLGRQPSPDPEWLLADCDEPSEEFPSYHCPACAYDYFTGAGSCPLCGADTPAGLESRSVVTSARCTPFTVDSGSAYESIPRPRRWLSGGPEELRPTYLPYWLWTGEYRFSYTADRSHTRWTKKSLLARPRRHVDKSTETGCDRRPLQNMYPATSAFPRLDLSAMASRAYPSLSALERDDWNDCVLPDIKPGDAFVGVKDRVNRVLHNELSVESARTETTGLRVSLEFTHLRYQLIYLSFWLLTGSRRHEATLVPAWRAPGAD